MSCYRTSLSWIVVTVAVVVLTGFGSRAAAEDLSGRWSGRWVSNTTGHKGPLKGKFRRLDDVTYSVTFTGRFWGFIPFRYSVDLNVVEDDEVVRLEGSKYLGRLLGTFYYEAEATATEFRATYTSCKDNGEWVLSRCCSTACDSK